MQAKRLEELYGCFFLQTVVFLRARRHARGLAVLWDRKYVHASVRTYVRTYVPTYLPTIALGCYTRLTLSTS